MTKHEEWVEQAQAMLLGYMRQSDTDLQKFIDNNKMPDGSIPDEIKQSEHYKLLEKTADYWFRQYRTFKRKHKLK